MRIALRALGFLSVLFVVSPARGAFVSLDTVPSQPAARSPFDIRVVMTDCYSIGPPIVNGSNIDVVVTFDAFCVTPPSTTRLQTVGPLPAGTYTIRLLTAGDNTIIATSTVVVAPGAADIPALDLRGQAILAITLMFAAALRLRGH